MLGLSLSNETSPQIRLVQGKFPCTNVQIAHTSEIILVISMVSVQKEVHRHTYLHGT